MSHIIENVSHISFCIVLYKSRDTLEPLLQSLSDHIRPGDEVLFADNSPTSIDSEFVQDRCAALGFDFTYFSLPDNPGFGAANNFLVEHSNGDFLVFLNPDAELLKIPHASRWPMGISGASITTSDHKPARLWGRSRTIGDEIRMRWLRRVPKYPQGTGYVSGAAMALRKEDFKALGGFSPEYFMYYEDIDICKRAGIIGIPVNISWEWEVMHIGGSSARKIKPISERRSLISSIIFFKKWNRHWRIYIWFLLLDSFLRCFLYLFRIEIGNFQLQIRTVCFLIKYFAFGTEKSVTNHLSKKFN